MTKNNIKPVVVLTVICVVVAALLAGVNLLTKDKISDNLRVKEQASLIEVLPTELGFRTVFSREGVIPDSDISYAVPDSVKGDIPETVNNLYQELSGKGYVVVLATTTQYSKGDMTVSVGISEGKVVGVSLTGYYESKDFGDSYPEKFVGAESGNVMNVEHVSGVTYSSNAFKEMISDALKTVELVDSLSNEAAAFVGAPCAAYGRRSSIGAVADDNGLPKTDAELLSLMKALVPSAADFTLASLEGAPETLKRLYSAADAGYVAYIVVPGQYVPVATEALVHIGGDGIIENVNLLSWIVGHDVGAGDFAEEFLNKDVWNFGDAELVSGATGTSSDFYNALNATLEALTDKLGVRNARFLDWVDRIVPNSKGFAEIELPADSPKELKALYEETSGRGSVAYIVVAGDYVPVATEALVYFDEFGTIKDVDLRSWIVGHGVEPGNFAEGFIGKNAETVNDVELVSAATGTSADFKDAVIGAMPFIPTSAPVYRYVALVCLFVAIVSFVAVIIITNKRRAVK